MNLLWVKFGSECKFRLGGSALAQVFNQLGDEAPDLDHVEVRLLYFFSLSLLSSPTDELRNCYLNPFPPKGFPTDE